MKKWLLFTLFVPLGIFGNLEDPQVISGEAKFFSDPSRGLTEITVSDNAVIDYKTFNIEQGETVRFIQSSAEAAVLNRITGPDPSHILGNLQSNGRIFFINPRGIFFGEHARVDVGSLIASTLNIAEEDFKKGHLRFQLGKESKRSQILNQGYLKAGVEGAVVLLAPYIKNEGVISAQVGKVALLSAQMVTLDLNGDGHFQFAIEGELEEGGVSHLGQILALGGKVWMRVSTAARIVDAVVNKEGFREGNFLTEENGVIKIKSLSQMEACDVDLAANKIEITGEVKAQESLSVRGNQEIKISYPLETQDLTLVSQKLFLDAPLETDYLHVDIKEYLIGADIHVKKDSLTFQTPISLTSQVVNLKADQRDVNFEGSIDGKTALNISAPLGTVSFQGAVGGKTPLLALSATGLAIYQGQSVKMAGPLFYQGRIFLKAGISNTNHPIVFDGPTMLEGESRKLIAVKGKGDVVFLSSLDGLTLDQALFIRAPEGSVQFNESIGKNGALKELNLNVKSASFKEITSIGKIDAVAQQVIDFHGKNYNTGEQRWKAPKFNIFGKGDITFTSGGNGIEFAQGVLHVENASSLTFNTEGGFLSFLTIDGKRGLDVNLFSKGGELSLGAVSGGVKSLIATGGDITLNDSLQADSIKIEAERNINTSAAYKVIAIKDVYLNAKTGNIASTHMPLWAEAGHKIWVGAQQAAYVQGEFIEGCLCGLPYNYPPLFMFNNFEYFESAYEILKEEDELISLASEINTRTKETKIDVTVIDLKPSSLYYEIADMR